MELGCWHISFLFPVRQFRVFHDNLQCEGLTITYMFKRRREVGTARKSVVPVCFVAGSCLQGMVAVRSLSADTLLLREAPELFAKLKETDTKNWTYLSASFSSWIFLSAFLSNISQEPLAVSRCDSEEWVGGNLLHQSTYETAYIYIYTYMYIYIYDICAYIYIYICIYVYIYIEICTYMYIHMCIHIYVLAPPPKPMFDFPRYIYIYIHIIYTYIYIYIHIYASPPLRSTFDALLETYMVKLNELKWKLYLIH